MKFMTNQLNKELDNLGNDPLKMRITTWVNAEVITEIKKQAKKKKIGYQTLLNQKLRELFLGQKKEKDDLEIILEKLDQLGVK